MEYTCSRRELPPLDALVTSIDENAGRMFPTLANVQGASGLAVDGIARAALSLRDVGLINLEMISGADCLGWFVTRVSAEARVEVGQWVRQLQRDW
jgi:hypothetical protein